MVFGPLDGVLHDCARLHYKRPVARLRQQQFARGLVKRTARQPVGVGKPLGQFAHVIGSGVQGLHQAIRRYAPDRGVPFERFAEPRIRGAIMDELRDRDPLTRRQRQGVRQVLTAMSEHVATHGNLPSHHDIAVRTQLSEGDVDSLLGMGAASVNLEEEFAEGLRYMDVIADTETLSPAEAADQSLSMEALRCAIRQLPERDQQLLYFRHHEQLGVKEIALAFDVTPGRVSQMYNEIVMRLRVLMKTNA